MLVLQFLNLDSLCTTIASELLHLTCLPRWYSRPQSSFFFCVLQTPSVHFFVLLLIVFVSFLP